MATRDKILSFANEMTNGDREADYGSPERNFERIAALWSNYLGHERLIGIIRPQDVAAMLSLLKIARIASGHAKLDNWVDLAGYAACGGEIETELEQVPVDGVATRKTEEGRTYDTRR